jgi:hypothetical protein
MAIQKSDHFFRFGPFYSYKTDLLKTDPFEYWNLKLSISSNGPDFGMLTVFRIDKIFEIKAISLK